MGFAQVLLSERLLGEGVVTSRRLYCVHLKRQRVELRHLLVVFVVGLLALAYLREVRVPYNILEFEEVAGLEERLKSIHYTLFKDLLLMHLSVLLKQFFALLLDVARRVGYVRVRALERQQRVMPVACVESLYQILPLVISARYRLPARCLRVEACLRRLVLLARRCTRMPLRLLLVFTRLMNNAPVGLEEL